MAPVRGMAWRLLWVSALFSFPATILPANVPNLVMSGAAEGSYGIHLNYLPYLLLHTPVLGWLKGGLLIALICWLFPGKPHSPREFSPPGANEPRRKATGLDAGSRAGDVGQRKLAWHWPGVDRAGGSGHHSVTACRVHQWRGVFHGGLTSVPAFMLPVFLDWRAL